MAATEPIRDKKQLKALGDSFLKRGQLRNYVMVVLGASTVLRISDLLRLKWADVYDLERQQFRTHITVREQKIGKTKTIALNKQVIYALRLYFPYRRGAFVFASNRREEKPISRVQAWRIIRCQPLGLDRTFLCLRPLYFKGRRLLMWNAYVTGQEQTGQHLNLSFKCPQSLLQWG